MENETQTTQSKSNMLPVAIVVVVLLVLAIAGFAILGKKQSTTNSSMMQTTPAAVSPTAMMMQTTPVASSSPSVSGMQSSAVKTFNVTGGNFFFNPAEIKVNKGDNVKIVFTNSGGVHDFVLDAFNVKTDMIHSGETATVTFVADKTGTFEYYCSVGNHRAMGMKGNLIVQ